MTKPKRATKARRKSKQELLEILEDMTMIVHQIPDEYDYIFAPGKHLAFSFLRGMTQTLGVFVGVVIVIPVVIWLITQFQWVPLVGDFMVKVQHHMQEAQLGR